MSFIKQFDDRHGRNLALAFLTLMAVITVIVVFQYTNKEPASVNVNEVIAAVEDNDEHALREIAQMMGMRVEDLKLLARREIADRERRARAQAREESLGTWQDAMENGNLMYSRYNDETDTTMNKYDVTGDSIGDFEIIFQDGKPLHWRYLDEQGDPYG